MSVRSKICHHLEMKKVSVRSLAGGDEKVRARINRQLYHDADLSLSTVMLFLDRFPEISTEWLLRDLGSKYSVAVSSEEMCKLTVEVPVSKYNKVLEAAGLDVLVSDDC